ncbi:hypothetical protein [Streptomyces sp. NPDC002788]
MANDESFDELMAQSSLGSAGAHSLREKTSPDAARLVLRVVELRDLLDSFDSSDTDPLALVRLGDELAGVMGELAQTGAGKGPNLVRVARNLARAGHLDSALGYMTQAKEAFDEADDWEGSVQVLAMRSAMLTRAGRNAEALATMHQMSTLLASRTTSGARLGALADSLRQDTARPSPSRTQPAAQGESGRRTLEADPDPWLAPRRGLLLAIGADKSADVGVLTQRQSQEAITLLVNEAADRTRLDRARWVMHEREDELLWILPEEARAPSLIDDFMPALNADLRAFNRGREADTRLRLRAAVHIGVIQPGGVQGFVSRSRVVRILNSTALGTVLDKEPGACLAVALSEYVFDKVVVAGHTAVPRRAFRRIQTRDSDSDKPWIWVPDGRKGPRLLRSRPAGAGSRTGTDGHPPRRDGI